MLRYNAFIRSDIHMLIAESSDLKKDFNLNELTQIMVTPRSDVYRICAAPSL